MQGGEPPATSVPAENVRAELARILSSESFISSPRLCRFLRFIVERALSNEVDRLKEFVVALEVFDRDEKYDPNIDSIVRVEARRLRKKLKTYYDGPGKADPVLIGLRPGSYVPLFRTLAPERPASPPVPGTIGAPTADMTVAVLPFVNMSPEPEQDYFCDGITEELINALTAVPNLNVVARTSSFQFKGQSMDVREVGRRLGARVVVEGSVRKAGDQLRITAQAIDAEHGYHLWSETYRRELRDIFAIQDELSAAIARTIHVRLPAARSVGKFLPPVDAYNALLEARFLMHQQTPVSLAKSLALFQDLTQRYPTYAEPFAGIANVRVAFSLFGIASGREVEPEMRRCAEEAVRLDPDLAEAWAILGGISCCWDFDWAEGEKRLLRAISLQPANAVPYLWYAVGLTMLGRFAEAEANMMRAIKLNPLGAGGHTRMAMIHSFLGDEQRASADLDQAAVLDPGFPTIRVIRAMLLMRRGDHEGAISTLAGDPEHPTLAVHTGLLAAACFQAERNREGQAKLRTLEAMARGAYVSPLAFAYAYIGMGDNDKAFEYLDRAITDRVVWANFLKVDPFFGPLRNDARFADLVRRLRLSA